LPATSRSLCRVAERALNLSVDHGDVSDGRGWCSDESARQSGASQLGDIGDEVAWEFLAGHPQVWCYDVCERVDVPPGDVVESSAGTQKGAEDGSFGSPAQGSIVEKMPDAVDVTMHARDAGSE
jgi:hypothetical protein